MEYVIAVFVGLWISTAGLLAYKQISADFHQVEQKNTAETEAERG